MVYSEAEKAQMDKVISVFDEYIKNSPSIDLLYSEKVGYVLIGIISQEHVIVESESIHTATELCNMLFNEVYLDYCVELLESNKDSDNMTDEELSELHKRFERFIIHLPEYAEIARKQLPR